MLDENGNMLNNIMDWNNNIIRVKAKKATYCWAYFDIKKDFCKTKGITNLRECLLASENYSETQEEAIEYITNKGSATTSAIAPTITFKEKAERVKGTVLTSTANFSLSTSYTFDETTGIYTLSDDFITTTLSDRYLNYYTCGGTTGGNPTCVNMYQIKAYTKTTDTSSTTYKVTDAIKYTYSAVDSFDSEIGLYKTKDEDGDTFFYRGAVKNNYVSFGGFIWRIVRINGNGSIRMIYSGTSTSATGADTSVGSSTYNTETWDPVYLGYTYDDSNMVYRENTTLTLYSDMQSSYVYYYGKNISCDDKTRKCQLSGDIMSGVWSEKHDEILAGGYNYTCLKTSATETCDVALKLDSYVNSSSANVYYISYNSKDYDTAVTDTKDSKIKDYVDSWYEKNIKDKKDSKGILLSDYLSDEVFCNDRQFYLGSGYLISPQTNYNSYNRIHYQYKPSLICGQSSDKYSVANGNLDYPVALLTIDEASFAGGKSSNVNNQFYLCSGQSYYTMTPVRFHSSSMKARAWYIRSTGELTPYGVTDYEFAVRPVINLSSNVQVTKGMGTVDKPYEVSL